MAKRKTKGSNMTIDRKIPPNIFTSDLLRDRLWTVTKNISIVGNQFLTSSMISSFLIHKRSPKTHLVSSDRTLFISCSFSNLIRKTGKRLLLVLLTDILPLTFQRKERDFEISNFFLLAGIGAINLPRIELVHSRLLFWKWSGIIWLKTKSLPLLKTRELCSWSKSWDTSPCQAHMVKQLKTKQLKAAQRKAQKLKTRKPTVQ